VEILVEGKKIVRNPGIIEGFFACFFAAGAYILKSVGEYNAMTQITAKQLTKRVQQLDDTQAGTVLMFIEFLLAQPNLKKRQNGSHANQKTLDALNRIYREKSADSNETYKLALRAMTRKGLPKW
jgi:hypothetical protein